MMQHHTRFAVEYPQSNYESAFLSPAKHASARAPFAESSRRAVESSHFTFKERGDEHDPYGRAAAPICVRAPANTWTPCVDEDYQQQCDESTWALWERITYHRRAVSLDSAAAPHFGAEFHEPQDQLAESRWAANAELECSPPPPPLSSPTRTRAGPNDDADLFFDLDES